jgi:hypothetical protein
MDNILIVVRGFELLSVLLFLGGLIWVIRQRKPLYYGAYLGACFAGIYFDWINNLNWFLRVVYDERFLTLFRIDGWPQPLAMSTTYAFYFGIPLIILIHFRDALQKRFGKLGQYLFVAVAGMIALPVFEIPMVQAFRLWTYYQKEQFLLGGVAWTNWIYSALLFLVIYASLKFVAENMPGNLVQAAAGSDRLKGVLFSFGAFVTAFASVQFLMMIVYAVTNPWIPSPRPF